MMKLCITYLQKCMMHKRFQIILFVKILVQKERTLLL